MLFLTDSFLERQSSYRKADWVVRENIQRKRCLKKTVRPKTCRLTAGLWPRHKTEGGLPQIRRPSPESAVADRYTTGGGPRSRRLRLFPAPGKALGPASEAASCRRESDPGARELTVAYTHAPMHPPTGVLPLLMLLFCNHEFSAFIWNSRL
jgi:hypothetical protein